MAATAKQKKDEFARGAEILEAAANLWPAADITRPLLNKFVIYYDGKLAGSFIWRLDSAGIGHIRWRPSYEYIDIAPRRAEFQYNYVDGVSDVEDMYDWASPIFDDILA